MERQFLRDHPNVTIVSESTSNGTEHSHTGTRYILQRDGQVTKFIPALMEALEKEIEIEAEILKRGWRSPISDLAAKIMRRVPNILKQIKS